MERIPSSGASLEHGGAVIGNWNAPSRWGPCVKVTIQANCYLSSNKTVDLEGKKKKNKRERGGKRHGETGQIAPSDNGLTHESAPVAPSLGSATQITSAADNSSQHGHKHAESRPEKAKNRRKRRRRRRNRMETEGKAEQTLALEGWKAKKKKKSLKMKRERQERKRNRKKKKSNDPHGVGNGSKRPETR